MGGDVESNYWVEIGWIGSQERRRTRCRSEYKEQIDWEDGGKYLFVNT